MEKRDDAWTDWPARLAAHVRETDDVTWAKIAKELDVTEGGVRHWRNGNREINLTEFFNLCYAAKADPAMILFGPARLTDAQRKRVGELVTTILESDTAANADYGNLITEIKKDVKRVRRGSR